jgi:GTP-binding protein EngB required for normal cell division
MLMDMLTESHRPFMMVLTKADKVKDKDIANKL